MGRPARSARRQSSQCARAPRTASGRAQPGKNVLRAEGAAAARRPRLAALALGAQGQPPWAPAACGLQFW